MGLDITALRKITRVGPCDANTPDGQHLVHVVGSFMGRADGLDDGNYTAEEVHGFRAGSYSGYNRWREHLSMAIHGDMPEVIWTASRAGLGIYTGKPFVELIDFSDCDGVIGPVTAAKLAADFKTHRETMSNKFPDLPWDMNVYDSFTKAFEMAADSGCVIFH